jgi:hypothetical protein
MSDQDHIDLPACPTEDSENCFWDAGVQGNGHGESFFTYDGQHVPLATVDGYEIQSVWVNPDALATYSAEMAWGVTFTETTTPPDPPNLLAASGLDFTAPALLVGGTVIACLAALAVMAYRGVKKS